MEVTLTELLFQLDSYLRQFSAQVLTVEEKGRAVILDRTAFYPGGGGQPADRGWLCWGGTEQPIACLERQGEAIAHILQANPPSPGATLEGKLDWPWRYDLMRTHTALHILCGVVWRDYGAQVTGGNMDPLAGRMDFEFESMRQELVREIEDKVNREVEASRDVRLRILPREEAFRIPNLIRTKINLLPESISSIRTVEIVGLDLQADGGTHVANTSEVGRVKVTEYKSKGRINKRIYIALDPLEAP